jgi:diacylglycerol kinase family enzyme
VLRSVAILNPNASRLRAGGVRERLEAGLRAVLAARDGVPPRIVVTGGAAESAAIVREALAAGAVAVVGAGGDGTLTVIADALAGSGVPLGIVPAGTGNVLAGVLGVPGSLEAAVAALRTADAWTIDLGDVRVQLADAPAGQEPLAMAFMIGAGIGFDAEVMATTPPELKRRIGRAAYFARAAWMATRLRVVPYRVTVDGEEFETDASIALVTNVAELVPGVLRPRLPVVPDDGLLDVFVLGARGPVGGVRGLLDHLVRTEVGQGAGSSTLRARGRRVRLEAMPPQPLQVDGDHLGPGALEAEVRPAALRVLVPHGSHRGAGGPGAGTSPGAAPGSRG